MSVLDPQGWLDDEEAFISLGKKRQTELLLEISERFRYMILFMGFGLGALLAVVVGWIFPQITHYTLWGAPFVLLPPLALGIWHKHWDTQLREMLTCHDKGTGDHHGNE